MARKIIHIKDVRGNVLHSVAAASRKEAISQLVKEGKSLRGVNLQRAQLAGVDLSDSDLREACLAGADLRGANLRGALLDGAILTSLEENGAVVPTRLQGADCTGARFHRTDLTGARCDGATFTFASFRGAILDDADLENSNCGSADFTHLGSAVGACFKLASMVNADFSYSTFISCDFSGTDISDRILSKVPFEGYGAIAPHLPDRAFETRAIACTFDKKTQFQRIFLGTPEIGWNGERQPTVLGKAPCTVEAFRTDRLVSRMMRWGLWTASVMGIVEGSEHALALAGLDGLVPGAGVLVAAGGVLLKEGFDEWAREHVEEGLLSAVRYIRGAATRLRRAIGHGVDLACLIGRTGSLEPVKLALAATRSSAREKGLPSVFSAFNTDMGHVVLCDRKHLAMALATISVHRDGVTPLSEDVILLRLPGQDRSEAAPTPIVIAFRRDGRSTAIWSMPGGSRFVSVYAPDGSLEVCLDSLGKVVDPQVAGLPSFANRRDSVCADFEDDIMNDHNLASLHYSPETHFVVHGRDGTIFVRRTSDRKIDNPLGPAVLRPNGTGLIVNGGSVECEWPEPQKSQVRGRHPLSPVAACA